MKKATAVLGIAKLTVPQKIEFARFVETSMAGNPHFASPSPALTVLNTAANELELAHLAALSGGKDETAVVRDKELALELVLKSVCSYVETIANGNITTAESTILSAGFGTKKQAAPRPNGFRLMHGKKPGEIIVRTDSDARAVFTFERTLTPDKEDSWIEVHSSTRAQITVTGLESGKHHYFRYAKTDKDGTGPWSNVLHLMAI
jgi:hypothetical protein